MKKQINEICKALGVAVISVIAILIIIRTLSWQQSIIKHTMVTREGLGGIGDSDDDSDDDSDSDSDGDGDGDGEDGIDKIHKNNKKIKNIQGLMDKSTSIKKYKNNQEKLNSLKKKNEKLLSGGGGMF